MKELTAIAAAFNSIVATCCGVTLMVYGVAILFGFVNPPATAKVIAVGFILLGWIWADVAMLRSKAEREELDAR